MKDFLISKGLWEEYKKQYRKGKYVPKKTHSKNIERNKLIHEMRIQGFPYREIGNKFGISHETARKIVMNHSDNP